jgi:hypothetical protein
MLAALGLAAFVASGPLLHGASPDFLNTVPRGAQRGTEVKVTFTGNRLDDAQELLFHYPGISFKDLKVVDPKKVEATLVIAPDCRLGEHHVRIRCASGTSYARTFWVSQFANVAEVEPNNEFEAPQAIPLNVTVEGAATPEDIDYYKISAKKGQRISIEVEALRLNNLRNAVAVDPYVAILDKDRFEIANSDDSALLKQESVLSVLAPEDGDYVVEVRDSAFQGRGQYRVHIGTYPRPVGIFPAGGKAGSEVEFTLIGDQKGAYKQKVKLPADGSDSHEVFAAHEGQLPPSGNKVRVVPFENIIEVEPNNATKEATAGAALPLAFNGVLSEPGDTDYFKFTATKGQKFRFRSYANQIGTPVDTVLYIYDAAGKSIGSSDDADGRTDSRIDFTAPADGEFFVRVRDMLDRGGEDFIYRIESEPYTPNIVVTMPEMLRRDTQYKKQFDIPKGNHFAMTVNVSRANVSGELLFDIPNLPAGVTWEADTIPANQSTFPIVFHAAADAPTAGGLYALNVKTAATDKPVVTGTYKQQLDFVRGNPNGTLYYSSDSSKLPVAVAEPAPFAISIDQPAVPLVRDGTLRLKVRAKRNGYEGKITVRMLWRPPGVSGPATVTIPEKQNEIAYELNANSAAEVRPWKITMLAEADAGKGLVTVASPFAELRIEEPYVGMKLNLATVPQGQKVDMICDLSQLRPFEGKATVNLYGLPAKSSTTPIEVTKDDKQVLFPITTAEDTPVGQHKNMFCTVVVTQNGQAITHRVGMGGVLRVDPKPKVAAKPAPAPEKKPVVADAKAAPAPKPLSRLEQLRLDAKKAAEAKKQ